MWKKVLEAKKAKRLGDCVPKDLSKPSCRRCVTFLFEECEYYTEKTLRADAYKKAGQSRIQDQAKDCEKYRTND
jgi:hypothetical protein